MVWGVISATPGANYGQVGHFEWLKPVVESPHTVAIPSDLKVIRMQSSWASDGVDAYNCGGFSQNAIWTRHLQLWSMGFRAPSFIPTVSLAAGPGLTASVICYLRFYDDFTGERSPLSAPSATLAAANQKIKYDALNTLEPPARATHIEAWESRDGLLPRFVFRRQIGVVTVTHALALGDLGEAETSDWTKPPRCRYAVFWHERLVMAGNDDDPTAVYFMEIGFPERWSGLFLRTKSKQAIVGLAEINDRLLCFCPFATEIVAGWTEDDLRISIIQPQLGLLSHQGLVQTDGWLWVPTHEQPFITDGSSWFPMGLDIKRKWSEDCAANRRVFQQMWAEHHPAEHVVRFYVGQASTDNHRNTNLGAVPWFCYYVADYETAIPLEGGSLGQPRWAYDSQLWEPTCYALLAVPGGRRRDPYKGAASPDGAVPDGGRVFKVGTTDAGNLDGNDAEIITPALQFGSVGGPADHALRLEELSMLLRSEAAAWLLEVYCGDVECLTLPVQADGLTDVVPAWTRTIDASAVAGKEPKWTHTHGALAQVTGRAFIVRIVISAPADGARLGGLAALWMPGTYDRRPGRTESGGG